jgi:hypothetical protein
MMLDHQTRISIAKEHAEALRETMLATRRRRRRTDDSSDGHSTARVYTLPRPSAQVERDAAA